MLTNFSLTTLVPARAHLLPVVRGYAILYVHIDYVFRVTVILSFCLPNLYTSLYEASTQLVVAVSVTSGANGPYLNRTFIGKCFFVEPTLLDSRVEEPRCGNLLCTSVVMTNFSRLGYN